MTRWPSGDAVPVDWLRPGTPVWVVMPGNDLLDGVAGTVVDGVPVDGYATARGGRIRVRAFVRGHDRESVLRLELDALSVTPPGGVDAGPDWPAPADPGAQAVRAARQQGYTGNVCPHCGSVQVIRDGKCEKCLACYSGIGSCS